MKKFLIGLAVVIVLLLVAAVAVPFFIPLDTYKQQIVAQVKNATGRDLAIAGPVSFSLLPRLELEANKVTFSNAAGAADPQMASFDQLQIRLQMFPLLHGEVAIDSFVLVNPVIHLEINKAGRPNWAFGEPAKAASPAAKSAAAGSTAASGGGQGATALSELRLGELRLANGTVTYADDQSGQKQSLDKVNVTLSLPDLESPFKAAGDLVWRGKQIALKANVANPRQIMQGKSTDIALDITSEPVIFDFKGTATGGGTMKLAGDIDLKVPSVRGLAAWAAKPIDAPGTGLGPLSIKGKLNLQGAKLDFSNAQIALDAITAKGELGIDATGAKPAINGRLDVDKLDVNPYLPPEKPASSGGKAATATPAAAQSSDWSDDPIDLSGLKAVNVDFALSANAILVRKIKIDRSALTLKLKDGVLTADLTQLALYQGSGKGQLVVNGAGAVPAVSANFTLAKVQAEPLFDDAAGFDRITGTADTSTDVTTHGKSQREMVSALQGKGAMNFSNGAIKGINLGAMARNVSSAFLDASAGKAQQTDFTELGGTYTITNGIVKNTDLAMKSPLLRIEGAGTVELPPRTVNYRLTPKLVASAEGQGGKSDAGGIAVPIIISGPWSNLSYKPDLAGTAKQLLQNPGAASNALKNLVPGTGGAASSGSKSAPSGVGGALKGLLGH
ncbi:MAG TPA: AsmA family protein [Candidatus Sulfotelmatobacter sp.]|nr:AsmA family protein [Candidatus Sulfotelmatobacter sp.]